MSGSKNSAAPAPAKAGKGEVDAGRSEVADRIVTEAERIVAAGGLPSLGVRDLAGAARCAVGSVYYLFRDLDGVILAMNRRTLGRLDAALEDASSGAKARSALHALAQGYLAFAARETRLLRALFEHRMKDGAPFPADHMALVHSTFARIERPLAALLPGLDGSDVAMMARTLFSAAHGIVTLGLEERIVAVPLDGLEGQLARFVDTFEAGLAARAGRSPAMGPSEGSRHRVGAQLFSR